MNGMALCSGYGGLEIGTSIAFEVLGIDYRTICHVERQAYCAATLVARMEDKAMDQAPVWDDLTTFDGRPWRGKVDCITAGYPCQPFSSAGDLKGFDDERDMWPQVHRIIGEVGPDYVILENVANHVVLGLDRTIGQLSEMGYICSWGVVSASNVGANHRRDRVFILASNANSVRLQRWYETGPITSTNDRTWIQIEFERLVQSCPRIPVSTSKSCRVHDGIANRVERLHMLGNGVVPLQSAYAICTMFTNLPD